MAMQQFGKAADCFKRCNAKVGHYRDVSLLLVQSRKKVITVR